MTTYLFEFLKKKCEEKGFFYSQLGDKADLSHNVLQGIKNGRTQLKPGTKQKLAAALGCTIGDIQDAIRRSDEVLENGEVLRKEVPEEPAPVPEPEPHCPYDDPVEPAAEPKGMPEKDPGLAKVVLDTLQQAAAQVDGAAIAETEKAITGDNVNHPAHYTQGGIECIEAIKASMTAQQFLGYLKGNAMKYLWRYQHKGGAEDLRKARWYLDRLIAEVEG